MFKKFVIAAASAILLFAGVNQASADGPIVQSTDGVIESPYGPVTISLLHTGDAETALASVGATAAPAYTLYGFKLETNPYLFRYNSWREAVGKETLRTGITAWNGLTASKMNFAILNTDIRALSCEGAGEDWISVMDWGILPSHVLGMACWHTPQQCDMRLNYKAVLSADVWRALATHEAGHCWGIGHSTDANSIMYPYIRPEVTTIGAIDIAAFRSLYGYRIWIGSISK